MDPVLRHSAGYSASRRHGGLRVSSLQAVDQVCDRTVLLANILDAVTTSNIVVLSSHLPAEVAFTLASTLAVWDAARKTGTFHMSLHELNLCLWNLLVVLLASDLGTSKM